MTQGMNGIFGLQGPVAAFINRLADCLLLNMVFLISCVPIVTIGCAWSALYYTVNKVFRHDRGYALREYVSAFRKNLLQAGVLWIGFLLFGVFLVADVLLVRSHEALGSMQHLPLLALLIAVIIWANCLFPYISRFEETNRDALAKSFLIAFFHLPKLLLATVLSGLVIAVVYFLTPALLIAPVVVAWWQSILLEKVFRSYMSEADRALEDERNGQGTVME